MRSLLLVLALAGCTSRPLDISAPNDVDTISDLSQRSDLSIACGVCPTRQPMQGDECCSVASAPGVEAFECGYLTGADCNLQCSCQGRDPPRHWFCSCTQ